MAAWGISKLRKRAGKFAGGIEGEGYWYDRVLSDEMLDHLQSLGVNLITLPFSPGGNEAVEYKERDDFERVTQALHVRGMVFLPYRNTKIFSRRPINITVFNGQFIWMAGKRYTLTGGVGHKEGKASVSFELPDFYDYGVLVMDA